MKTYCKPFRRGAAWRSQNFRPNPNNGTNGAGGHTGNDEAAPVGTPVYAAGDGVEIYAGTFDGTYADNLLWLLNFGGNILVLDCGDTEPTFVYAHLHNFKVGRGTRVRKGQLIADSGNSGTRTTGAHLHIECIPPGYTLHSPTLGRVNPDRYLTEWPEDLTVNTQSTVKEEIMPSASEIATEILHRPIDRAGGIGGTLSLAEMIAWYDPNNLAIPAAVWSYTNPSIDDTRDTYQVLRDIPRTAQAVVADIPDNIAQEVLDALSARLAQ